jgi:hypothetical protein
MFLASFHKQSRLLLGKYRKQKIKQIEKNAGNKGNKGNEQKKW